MKNAEVSKDATYYRVECHLLSGRRQEVFDPIASGIRNGFSYRLIFRVLRMLHFLAKNVYKTGFISHVKSVFIFCPSGSMPINKEIVPSMYPV